MDTDKEKRKLRLYTILMSSMDKNIKIADI